MARLSPKSARAARKRKAAAINLVALGIAFALLPMFLSHSPVGAVFRPLAPIGWLMMLAGGALLWLQREKPAASDASVVSGSVGNATR